MKIICKKFGKYKIPPYLCVKKNNKNIYTQNLHKIMTASNNWLRQERREKAFEILNDERSSTEEVEENGNSYVTLWRRLSQEECDTIYNAADGIDDWTSLLSIGGNGGKSYTSECELPEGNYTCVDVTVSVTNFISGFTAYFMK